MLATVADMFRLAKAARTFAKYDFFLTPEQKRDVPWPARLGMAVLRFGRGKA